MQAELLPILRALLNDPLRLDNMKMAAIQLAKPDGALNVARVLAEMAGG